jgi:hypothetical protein
MPLPQPYNTGLTEEQVAEAFRRALTDMTDAEIMNLLNAKADKAASLSLTAPTTKIQTDDDLDTYINVGQWTSVGATLSSLSNVPDDQNDFELIVMHTIAEFIGLQVCIYVTGDIYIRTFTSVQDVMQFGTWSKLTMSSE